MTSGSSTKTYTVPGGISRLEAPLQTGAGMTVKLVRGRQTYINFTPSGFTFAGQSYSARVVPSTCVIASDVRPPYGRRCFSDDADQQLQLLRLCVERLVIAPRLPPFLSCTPTISDNLVSDGPPSPSRSLSP